MLPGVETITGVVAQQTFVLKASCSEKMSIHVFKPKGSLRATRASVPNDPTHNVARESETK